jgi:hypothetical protein
MVPAGAKQLNEVLCNQKHQGQAAWYQEAFANNNNYIKDDYIQKGCLADIAQLRCTHSLNDSATNLTTPIALQLYFP